MKILFVSLNSNNSSWYVDNKKYWEGPINDLPENLVKEFRDKRVDEPYSFSKSNTHIKELCSSLLKVSNIESKVNMLLKAYSEESREVPFENGEANTFKVIPESSDECKIYNTKFIDYHIKNSPECSFEWFKKDFKIKLKNSPDIRKLKDLELRKIERIITNDNPFGVCKWYKAAYKGLIPKDKTGYSSFVSNIIEPNLVAFLIGKSLAEYETYLNNDSSRFKKSNSENPITQKQIALMYRYLSISNNELAKPPIDWHKIAEEYGYDNPTSGVKLYQRFNENLKKTDRINYDLSSRDINRVIELLSEYPEAKAIAESELKEISSK